MGYLQKSISDWPLALFQSNMFSFQDVDEAFGNPPPKTEIQTKYILKL